MKRRLVLVLAVLAGAAVFAGLVYGVLVVAHVAEPGAITTHGTTARRLWSTSGVGLALVGVVTGGLALTRSGAAFGRRGVIAFLAGLIAMVNGGLVLAAADGGPGTGNGVVGGAVAVVLGLIAVSLGGLASSRSRR